MKKIFLICLVMLQGVMLTAQQPNLSSSVTLSAQNKQWLGIILAGTSAITMAAICLNAYIQTPLASVDNLWTKKQKALLTSGGICTALGIGLYLNGRNQALRERQALREQQALVEKKPKKSFVELPQELQTHEAIDRIEREVASFINSELTINEKYLASYKNEQTIKKILHDINVLRKISSETGYGKYNYTDEIGAYVNFTNVDVEGETPQPTIVRWLQRDPKASYNDKRNIAGEYKIHLMPKFSTPRELYDFVFEFASKFKRNEILKKNIAEFKILSTTRDNYLKKSKGLDRYFEEHGGQVPLIAIYVGGGKRRTQAVLNELYKLYGDREGSGIKPRFNAKVTDLIWVAQGNSDEKLNPELKGYYDKSLVYYNEKLPYDDNEDNHFLKHPKTKAWILADNTEEAASSSSSSAASSSSSSY